MSHIICVNLPADTKLNIMHISPQSDFHLRISLQRFSIKSKNRIERENNPLS